MRNERGATLVVLLALLPLLAAITSVAFAGYLLLSADGRTRHACRAALLGTQAEIARNLHELFALNPGARRLRERRLAAEARVAAAAGMPAAQLAAQTQLQAVIQAQLAFALRQKKWLIEARRLTQAAPARALSRVRVEVREAQGLSNNYFIADEWKTSAKRANLILRVSPAHSLTPDYSPAPNFREFQEIHLRWSFAAGSLLPRWLLLFINTRKLQAAGECAATLKKENGRWRPLLTREGKR